MQILLDEYYELLFLIKINYQSSEWLILLTKKTLLKKQTH